MTMREYRDKIKKLLDEMIIEHSCEWNRRCEKGERYYFILPSGKVTSMKEGGSMDDNLYQRYNYFPCSHYTSKQLDADGVGDMSTEQRMEYKKHE